MDIQAGYNDRGMADRDGRQYPARGGHGRAKEVADGAVLEKIFPAIAQTCNPVRVRVPGSRPARQGKGLEDSGMFGAGRGRAAARFAPVDFTLFHEGRADLSNQIVCDIVAGLFGLGAGQVVATGRGRARTAFARQLAIYLCHVIGSQSQRQVGRHFGRDRKTVSHACHVIEDCREDEGFDAVVVELEDLVSSILELLKRTGSCA